jgi:hypothetical protein
VHVYTNIPVTKVKKKNIMKEILDNDNHTPESKKHELTIVKHHHGAKLLTI